MALNTDLVRNATPNFATTLANSMLISDTSMTLQSATGLPTATAITLVIDATDPVSGAATPSLKEVVTGTLSGTTVSNLVRGLDSTTQQGHASGANVVMWITANLWNDFQTSYLVGHTQLGAHTSNLPLTSPKITTGLNDSNNNLILGVTATASAVNQVTLADAATGNAPTLSATGTDTNIGITLAGKGTGSLNLSSLLSNGITSYTNGGSAGGTFYYINLGGIKLLWGITGSINTGSGGVINYPASFFTSSPQSISSSLYNVAGTADIYLSIATPSSSSCTVNTVAGAGAGSCTVSLIAIGT